MKKIGLIILMFVNSYFVLSQGGWSWNQLPDMPIKTSNNAVTSAVIGDTTYVYSFLGIDTTKNWNGIHSKAVRYNTVSQVWDTISDVPDSLGGLIAASATTIKNKIVIIGGYHVYSGGNEISSREVHIYDPISNTYSRGTNIPIEIDDHVQLPYNDSLIYVITGWTSTIGGGNNTNAVQIYDVVNDKWHVGTPTPNTTIYKVFGASGAIVNNTIYYTGGARVASNFPLVTSLRKGVIDVNNPLNISWSSDTVFNYFKPYRATCFYIKNKVFWIGGSSVSYNYNGLAYSNNSGVDPNNFLTEYNIATNNWAQYNPTPFEIMDLRGIAQIDYNKFVITGGMIGNQNVTNKVFELAYDTTFKSTTDFTNTIPIQIKNSYIIDLNKNGYIYSVKNKNVAQLELVDLFGRTIKQVLGNNINVLGEQGIFFLQVTFSNGRMLSKRISIN